MLTTGVGVAVVSADGVGEAVGVALSGAVAADEEALEASDALSVGLVHPARVRPKTTETAAEKIAVLIMIPFAGQTLPS